MYSIIGAIVESIIREHHARHGQQPGIGYGIGQNFGFAGIPQHEHLMLQQTISAIVPVIVDVIERERTRLNLVGQNFSPESINSLTQQVLGHVQQLSPSSTIVALIPGIVETICRQLAGQSFPQQTSMPMGSPSMASFSNIAAMV